MSPAISKLVDLMNGKKDSHEYHFDLAIKKHALKEEAVIHVEFTSTHGYKKDLYFNENHSYTDINHLISAITCYIKNSPDLISTAECKMNPWNKPFWVNINGQICCC